MNASDLSQPHALSVLIIMDQMNWDKIQSSAITELELRAIYQDVLTDNILNGTILALEKALDSASSATRLARNVLGIHQLTALFVTLETSIMGLLIIAQSVRT